jgi:excisionase family DNA binding protein
MIVSDSEAISNGFFRRQLLCRVDLVDWLVPTKPRTPPVFRCPWFFVAAMSARPLPARHSANKSHSDISLDSGDRLGVASHHPRLLTIREVAAILRCSRSAVYALVSDGRIVAYRIGPNAGGIRISADDLAIYLSDCRTGGAALAGRLPQSGGNYFPNPPVVRSPSFKHLDGQRLRQAWKRNGH